MQIWLDSGQRLNGVDLVNGEDLLIDSFGKYFACAVRDRDGMFPLS